jgi:hypothetical protein
MVESVGSDSISHFEHEQQWEKELDELAKELLAERELLDNELGWLTSEDAKSAFEFGYRLGKLDEPAALIDRILRYSRDRAIGFARGYVAGLLSADNRKPDVVAACLDNLEEQDPLLSFQIALAGGPTFQHLTGAFA